MNRTELRKKIMTILYQIFLYDASKIDYKVEDVIKESCEIENEFVNEIVNGVLDNKNDIDKIANINFSVKDSRVRSYAFCNNLVEYSL